MAIGVSKNDCDSHQQFTDKSDLKVELLTDTDGSLCEAGGILQKKENNGVKKMSVMRSTYIIKVGMPADRKTSTDETSGLTSGKTLHPGFSLQFIQLLPDYVRAMYRARDLPQEIV